ncbi:LPXTG cell wall anchor domain-containing protein [Streptococcus anginosus]|jgi:hypothetical protein|uniref:LPXTG cell wall anchor domain-containing protein n=2 Tax=Streptococcus TaxID=1301 RepID=A0AAU7PWE0_9STRE|nr:MULTISPECIES: LPXTG cell wall anchor domain-containing protein [Streptococcus]MBC5617915.1 LPXTG cell wall anchor domain-containing protein [Streptococcus hominis]MCW0925028.1 LPXTG cell wall anchor domain-containing protein [Streptococcus anginosus]QOG25167.1 LPXTG cell wall anchor domain-containing protein [Streptococcus sp. KS 6]
MKKTSFIALITLSSLVLSQVAAFADEGTPPVDSTASVVVTPTQPSSTPSETNPTPTIPPVDNTATPNVTPSIPDASTDPTTPSTTEPSKDDAVLPKDSSSTVEPSTDKQDSTTSPSEDTTQKPSDQPNQTDTTDKQDTTTIDNKTVTVPTVDGGKTTLTPSVDVPTNNPNVSAQTAVNAGGSQVGTTSQVTGQIVQNVTPAAPVYTNTGYQIVSTLNSQVVVAYADGSRATVSPEEVGGTVNADKTISVQTASGEMKTLPSTGDELGLLASFSGFVLLIGAWLLRKKNGADKA